jgi:hypothetical protein
VFNVGNKRRVAVSTDQSADFFAASNQDAKAMRDKVAFEVLDEAMDWLGMCQPAARPGPWCSTRNPLTHPLFADRGGG